MQDYEYHLDVFGQHTAQIYTQICLCFPPAATTPRENIVTTLNNGLHRLATAFPWTAGHVTQDHKGVFKITARGSTNPRIVVKDLSSTLAMRSMRQSDYPIASLDEDLLCPVRTRPNSLDVWPVFVVQATFVNEGLLLTCTLQHQAGDMTALAQVMHLLNKACCDEGFSEEELNIGNVDRTKVIPLYDDVEQTISKEQSGQLTSPEASAAKAQAKRQEEPSNTATSPTLTWANFAFSEASLTALKAKAMKDVHPGSYVSTDDTLSAFIWRHMTLAKIPRLKSKATTTFGRTVDMRRHIGIPRTYAGVAAAKASVTENAHELASHKSLGAIATALREAISPKTTTLANEFTMLATLRSRANSQQDEPSTSNSGLRLDLTKDIMLSSWAKYTEIWSFDFGLDLGLPESVRRPLFRPAKEGLVYLLPKRPDGQIVVVLCMRQEDLERLKEDREWMRWGKWIG